MNDRNRQFADGEENFANQPVLSLALRELRVSIFDRRFWLAASAVILVLAISGPFGTSGFLTFFPRLLYWSVVALTAYLTGLGCSLVIGLTLGRLGMARKFAILCGGALAGLPVAIIVAVINRSVFGVGAGAIPSITFVAQCMAISIAVAMLYYLLNEQRHVSDQPVGAGKQATQNPFLERLPRSIGTDLISLQARDHYVEVTTTSGSELVLMRLTDAIDLLRGDPEIPGMRIHRSWWVANKHVKHLRRDNGRTFLVLANGTEAPVSRGHLAGVRKQFERAPR